MKLRKLITIYLLAAVLAAVGACGAKPPQKSLALDKTSAVTRAGGSPILLTAILAGFEDTPVWESSDPTVAAVTVGELPTTALVKGHKAGTADVRVTAGGMTAVCAVTVDDPPVLVVETPEITLNVGKSASIRISTNLSPVSYRSDDTSKVTVTDEGLVSGVAAGRATVTVTAGSRQDVCTVTVVRPEIALDAETLLLSLDPGQKKTAAQLTATVNPEAKTAGVAWRSSDDSVATVTQTGLVTAKGVGEAVITAVNDTASASCAVKVKQTILTLSLDPAETVLDPGATLRLTATLTPNQTGEDAEIVWSTIPAGSEVASVDETGLVTVSDTAEPGAEVIVRAASVLDPDAYADCAIAVTDPLVGWLRISDKESFESVMVSENRDKNIYLLADVDLGGAVYTNLIEGFTGIFDGRGHTLSNFTVTSLFYGAGGTAGTIKNLGITCTAAGAGNNGLFGLFVAASGVIENCRIDITFDDAPYQAVFARNAAGAVRNCVVTIDNTAGGLAMAGCTQGGSLSTVFYLVRAGAGVQAGGAVQKT